MATNYVQPGATLKVTAPAGGVVSNDGVLIGNIFGIAQYTAAAGAEVEILTEGVVRLGKTAPLVIAAGDLLYWDAANGVVNTTAIGQAPVGVAVAAAIEAATTVEVKLGAYLAASDVVSGVSLTVAAPAAVEAGDGVLIGNLFGVALADAESAAPVEIQTEGVVTLAKTSALEISVGDILYWDDTAGEVNKTATDQAPVGIAVSAAANPSATVLVKLGSYTVTAAGGG